MDNGMMDNCKDNGYKTWSSSRDYFEKFSKWRCMRQLCKGLLKSNIFTLKITKLHILNLGCYTPGNNASDIAILLMLLNSNIKNI